MKAFIVWNESKTEGFVTTDAQLAYEVRKGGDSNCFNEEGELSKLGVTFCDLFSEDRCTIQEVEI